MPVRRDAVVRVLLDRHGTTYLDDVGPKLKDSPAPLFGLLILSLLLSARISSGIAVAAARALRREGWTSAAGMAGATWADRTRVLNRSGYARYDERTSRMLGDTAAALQERYRGDLRRLRAEADCDVRALRKLLTGFTGIGEVGASIFLREVQGVWDEVYPFVDERERGREAARPTVERARPRRSRVARGLPAPGRRVHPLVARQGRGRHPAAGADLERPSLRRREA